MVTLIKVFSQVSKTFIVTDFILTGGFTVLEKQIKLVF